MDEENIDIAAAMGFSSFGGTKKRKFEQTNSPKGKADASGANSTELGVRPKPTESKNDLGATTSIEPPIRQQNQPHSASGLAAFLARGQALPSRPDSAPQSEAGTDASHSEMVSFGGPEISRAELNALRFGVKNDNGDTAYFLPSFLEDPWARLEQSSNQS